MESEGQFLFCLKIVKDACLLLESQPGANAKWLEKGKI